MIVRPAALIVAFVLAACSSPVVSPAPDPAPTPTSAVLGSGMLHLTTAEEDYDTHDALRIAYVGADGLVAGEPDLFDAETTIYLDRSFAAGTIHVLANSRLCDGAIAIQANVEVDALLASSSKGCSVSIADAHPAGSIVHPQPRTAIGAFVVVGSVLVVRPLDPGNTMDPIRKPADDRAEVTDFDIEPGRYELALEVDGVVLKTREIDLKRGQEFYYSVRALAPGVPRDCGNVAAEACAAAVAAAYEQPQGNGTPAALHVTSVRVRPSRFTGGCRPFDPPVYDVSFDFLEEPGTMEVTLGARPDGRLYYCTY
jgi:hypothetical protein